MIGQRRILQYTCVLIHIFPVITKGDPPVFLEKKETNFAKWDKIVPRSEGIMILGFSA